MLKLAIRTGMCFARGCGLYDIIVESDCLVVINALSSEVLDHSFDFNISAYWLKNFHQSVLHLVGLDNVVE